MDELDARRLIEQLRIVVRTLCNQHGLQIHGDIAVDITRRWDRASGTLTVSAQVDA